VVQDEGRLENKLASFTAAGGAGLHRHAQPRGNGAVSFLPVELTLLTR